MKFRSRISIVLAAIILVAFGLPLVNDADDAAAALMIGAIFISVCAIFVTINYTISEANIIVRCLGFKMATIDIARIKSVKRSYNPLSSPAASIKRLEVKFYYKGKLETALISPVREAEFLAKLKEINPNIAIKVETKQNVLHFWNWDI